MPTATYCPGVRPCGRPCRPAGRHRRLAHLRRHHTASCIPPPRHLPRLRPRCAHRDLDRRRDGAVPAARARTAGRGVRLIFQPAEETSPGGALDAIEGGVLTDVTEVYALHCDPRTEVGRLAFKVGPITAAVDRVKITLTGAGGHTSRPHLTADLVGALGAVATSMQLLLSRRVDPRSGVSLVWVESTPVPSPTRSPRPGPSRHAPRAGQPRLGSRPSSWCRSLPRRSWRLSGSASRSQ